MICEKKCFWFFVGALILGVWAQENEENIIQHEITVLDQLNESTATSSTKETGKVSITATSHDAKPTSSYSSTSSPETTTTTTTSTTHNDSSNNPLIVKISTGEIQGRELKTTDQQKPYYAYQGIPFAKPPVGELRFREPVAPEKWNGTLPTLDDGPRCIQFVSVAGSEDCLYLNVFSPKHNNPVLGNSSKDSDGNGDKLLPVMVWIYGGAFLRGSSKIEKFGPDYFINEDVVIVSFNYRLGVFGFLSTEDYAATGNWGLKDQIMALKWVQENIEKFGGDANNVTIFGESAGSVCVSILIQSPMSRGLFHKAIMQSGTSLNQWAHAKYPRRSAFAIGKLLDIHTNDAREMVEHLRKVDYRTLHVVSLSTDLGETIFHNPLDGLVFAPSTEVNHPTAVITNNSHSILKHGDFNRIPVIVGFNSQEALGLIDVLAYLKPYVASYDLFSTRLVPGSLNIQRNLRKIVVAQMIRAKYFGWRPIVLSNDRLIQFVTDDQFARPIYEYIRQSSKYAPTYFYIFSYEGPLGLDGQDRGGSGVAHAEENNYLWNKNTNINNAPHQDILTRQRLVRLWCNFAKTGNPTPVADELLQNVTWPPTNIKTMVYLNITQKLELDTDIERFSIHFWDEIFHQHGNPPYDTY